MPDILSLKLDELKELEDIKALPSFRAKQIFSWLHKEHVTSFGQMTNLSKDLRKSLSEKYEIRGVKELKRQVAKDGTTKFLFELFDGNTIETVLLPHSYGKSLCISTQVGCRMGCKFCASTIAGKVRDLTASEMLSQVYQVGVLCSCKIDSIVLMGMGEPLDNFDNVKRFLSLIDDKDGLCLSHRHISLSTCGIVPKIYELADMHLQLTLSVSLHACNNEIRDKIMPVNHSYKIEELMAACKYYFAKTGRRISYEYSLIAGVNDSVPEAKELSKLLNGQNCHVNLIPVNPVRETSFNRGKRPEIEVFCKTLNQNGITATIRREFGTEIDAACGQLRRKTEEAKNAKQNS